MATVSFGPYFYLDMGVYWVDHDALASGEYPFADFVEAVRLAKSIRDDWQLRHAWHGVQGPACGLGFTYDEYIKFKAAR